MNDKNETTREEAWDHYCTVTASERRIAVSEAQLNWQSPTTQRHVTEYPVICHEHHHTTAQYQWGCGGGLCVGAVLPGHGHWYSSCCGKSPLDIYLCQLSTQATLIKRGSPLSHTSCAFALFVSDHVYSPETKVHPFSCYTATYLQIMTMYCCWCFQMQLNYVFVLQNRPAPSPAAASVHIRPVRGTKRSRTRAVVEGGGYKGSHFYLFHPLPTPFDIDSRFKMVYVK